MKKKDQWRNQQIYFGEAFKLMARAGARAYNGIWKQKPAGCMGRARGQGVRDCMYVHWSS